MVSLTSGYHPESNAQTKCTILKLSQFLRAYCISLQYEWADFLVWAKYAQNSLHHSATDLTPFEFLEHQPPPCPWDTMPFDVI